MKRLSTVNKVVGVEDFDLTPEELLPKITDALKKDKPLEAFVLLARAVSNSAAHIKRAEELEKIFAKEKEVMPQEEAEDYYGMLKMYRKEADKQRLYGIDYSKFIITQVLNIGPDWLRN